MVGFLDGTVEFGRLAPGWESKTEQRCVLLKSN